MVREEIIALRQRLLDHGLQPVSVLNWDYTKVPEKLRGKCPSETDWQNTVGMPPYRSHAQNTGILARGLRPLDVDIEDQTIVAEIIAEAERRFGKTIVRYRVNSPRCLLLYRGEGRDARKVTIPL